LQDLDQNSRVFLKFIQDAYKIGLVSSILHADTRGILYSIHPLVSRWLRSRRDKDHILEAAFLTFHLVCDLDKTPHLTDLHFEAGQHALACINLNGDLPESLRLGIRDLRQVGLKFVAFSANEIDISEAQFEILRAALSSEKGESRLIESDEYPDWSILIAMGTAKRKMGDYDEAKILLLRAKCKIPVWMTQPRAILLEDLIAVYIKLQDERSLQRVYKDLVEHFQLFSLPTKQYEQLNPRQWISLFHNTTCSFRPRHDLSALALANFLELLEQQQLPEESEEIRMIALIAEYYQGLSCFGAGQFREAQNTFLSLLRKTAPLTCSDFVLFLEIGSRFFNGVAQCLLEGKDVVNVSSETVQQISRTRLLKNSNETIPEGIESALKLAIEGAMLESSNGFLKLNIMLRNIILPR
jgi:tetratricopeptide (TPR) repeat protein